MGIVYLAQDVALERPVALKLLQPQLASQPALKQRFLNEARTAAKLAHPNIIPIFTVDEVDDFVFFVMAFVDGETLGQRIWWAGITGWACSWRNGMDTRVYYDPGGVLGFRTRCEFVPALGLGWVVLTNVDDQQLPKAIREIVYANLVAPR